MAAMEKTDTMLDINTLETFGSGFCTHNGQCRRHLMFQRPKLCFQQHWTDYPRSAAVFVVIWLISFNLIAPATQPLLDWILAAQEGWAASTPKCHHAASPKVKLEAHIMSKCPDARDCMRELILPTMQSVSDDIDFTLSYIGKNIEGDDAVECMHGQTECLGNIIQLCAATYYHDPKIYLGFSMCLMNQYHDIPQKSLVYECALEHGISFDQLNECASDEAMGMDLLRNSVARSANANVTTSCTVRLNEEVRCIRDGGEWKNCDKGSRPEDLIRDIKSLQDKGR